MKSIPDSPNFRAVYDHRVQLCPGLSGQLWWYYGVSAGCSIPLSAPSMSTSCIFCWRMRTGGSSQVLALFNPPAAPLLQYQDISEQSALQDLPSSPNSLEWLNEIDFADFSVSDGNIAFDTLFEQVASPNSLDKEISSDFPPLVETFEAGSSTQQHSDVAHADDHIAAPLPTQDLLTVYIAGAGTQVEQTALPPQASTTATSSTQLEQAPRNSDGDIICDHVDCRNKTLVFANIRNWSKHKNKHERPYRCTIPGCIRTQGFAAKGDQIRHERTVHKTPNSGGSKQDSTNTLFFCSEPNCPRGPGSGNGFSRKDNLMHHVKQRHQRVLASSRHVSASTQLDIQTPVLPLPDDRQMASLEVAPRKRRHASVSLTPNAVDVEDTNMRKKSKQEDRDGNDHTEPAPRERALMREVEKLRKELEKVQREKDILMEVVHRLNQGPR
ncbi:hypothetical protein V2W45_1072462 [Cenococcum geophilum]